ncbi:MAG: cupin domain-containing protein [Rhodospirillales bacterium]|nr:MAG: cupin domain-containing protein [Rhodospirillales bacterium]
MTNTTVHPRRARGAFASAAGIAVGLFALSGAANAGQCPADKRGVDVTKPVAHAAKGVTDTVLTSIDLAKETNVKADGRMFRLRRLVVQPGGIVPWHSHGDRPAIIYVVEGEIVEYASNCAVGILHKAGESTPELKGTAHWWRNMGAKPAVLLSADLLADPHDKHM